MLLPSRAHCRPAKTRSVLPCRSLLPPGRTPPEFPGGRCPGYGHSGQSPASGRPAECTLPAGILPSRRTAPSPTSAGTPHCRRTLWLWHCRRSVHPWPGRPSAAADAHWLLSSAPSGRCPALPARPGGCCTPCALQGSPGILRCPGRPCPLRKKRPAPFSLPRSAALRHCSAMHCVLPSGHCAAWSAAAVRCAALPAHPAPPADSAHFSAQLHCFPCFWQRFVL